ncbi:MAG: GxxExxY protein [Muribaculaceae bacterium]|nr:GxxExxY protein [Muribaculaceae bacterium]
MDTQQLNDLSHKIIGAAIEVHDILGPGLYEQTYHAAMIQELKLRGIKAESEVPIPFIYKGTTLNLAYRADIIVEDEIILELKSTESNSNLHCKQLLTYLRLTDKRLGLLINFNKSYVTEGIHRVANKL